MKPDEILESRLQQLESQLETSIIRDPNIYARIELVSRNVRNRAGVRVLLACALAKAHRPEIDIRKPYTEIGDTDAYSGRTYDERYIGEFVQRHSLPANPTTAFLTPALRNRNTVLTPEMNLSGRPREVYAAVLQLLTDVYRGALSAENLLDETIRQLLLLRNENQQRIQNLLANLRLSREETGLSAEAIITLIEQHLASKNSSRLPVLVVAAAYQAAEMQLGEKVLPVYGHNAADSQTQALGDLQIALMGDDGVVTAYEMKTRRVTKYDLDLAVSKIVDSQQPIENYIFITTDVIEADVFDYARSLYTTTSIEFTVLDCVQFLRYFLYLFYRLRSAFLERYQQLVMDEPSSAVSQPLKEVFLALRLAAESGEE